MKFEIIPKVDFELEEPLLKNTLQITCEFLKEKKALTQSQSELSVYLVFVSKNEIQELNHNFREKDQPTDVLSFAPNEPGFLGELILRSKRQQQRYFIKDHINLP